MVCDYSQLERFDLPIKIHSNMQLHSDFAQCSGKEVCHRVIKVINLITTFFDQKT